MSPAWIDAVLHGRRDEAAEIGGLTIPANWPGEQFANRLRIRAKDMLSKAQPQEWLTRSLGKRETGEMIGQAGFHGSPVEGMVEIGYTVFEPHRRNGYAEESVRALMHWAQDVKSIHRFRLSITPDNQPSLGLCSKLGFVRTGEQMDLEDGLEYVFDLDLS